VVHPNETIIESFYTAFKNSNPAGMIEHYHDEVEFSDPVFPHLKGLRAKAMWAMLGARQADPKDRTFSDIHADDSTGSAHWEAKYLFPKTGRPVHNKIDARFEFRDGKIWRHTDTFDFWKWAGMALGPPGLLLGWTPFLKGKVRKQVADMLEKFIAEHPQYQS
jgi:ketosteroid isomerase-like protein